MRAAITDTSRRPSCTPGSLNSLINPPAGVRECIGETDEKALIDRTIHFSQQVREPLVARKPIQQIDALREGRSQPGDHIIRQGILGGGHEVRELGKPLQVAFIDWNGIGSLGLGAHDVVSSE